MDKKEAVKKEFACRESKMDDSFWRAKKPVDFEKLTKWRKKGLKTDIVKKSRLEYFRKLAEDRTACQSNIRYTLKAYKQVMDQEEAERENVRIAEHKRLQELKKTR